MYGNPTFRAVAQAFLAIIEATGDNVVQAEVLERLRTGAIDALRGTTGAALVKSIDTPPVMAIDPASKATLELLKKHLEEDNE